MVSFGFDMKWVLVTVIRVGVLRCVPRSEGNVGCEREERRWMGLS